MDGNKIQNEVQDLHKVIQHEIDHLNGILYTERLADKRAFGFEKEILEHWKNVDEKNNTDYKKN